MALVFGISRMPGPSVTFSALRHKMQWEAVVLPYYLLLCRSITHAQRMSRTLERSGIKAPFFRPPIGLSNRGCSYAVRVGANALPAALERLRPDGLMPMSIFYTGGDGTFSEVNF